MPEAEAAITEDANGDMYVPTEEEKHQLDKEIRKAEIPQEGSFEHFYPDPKTGLNSEQVKMRFKQLLFNEDGKRTSRSYLSIILSNLCTFFNLLALLVAIALLYSGASFSQFSFALIFAINIGMGIVTEIRAKRRIDKLNLVSTPTAKVVRNGTIHTIPAKEIVVDDILLLETGQQIPVDCILLSGGLEVNESLLTGESAAVRKIDGDMLYAGSFVISGHCRCSVQAVGRETYINKLSAKAKTYKPPKSEIRNSTNMFLYIIAPLILVIGAGIFYINWPETIDDLPETIQATCAVIIGMIPSGMLLLSSLAMSTGIIRLSKNNTLVNDMYSLEMLARVDTLCLDKTGTITDGRMKVNEVVLLNSYTSYSIQEIMGSLNAALNDNNQTAIALADYFGRSSALKPTKVIHFSSKRKLSAASFLEAGTYVMGAPEFVLRPMPSRVERLVRENTQKGLRVMVLAYSPNAINGDRLPAILRPVALITLTDNIREDAPETIRWFRENDVDVKIISGDDPLTVAEVARRAGVANTDNFISLDGLSDIEVESIATKYTVFGRVSPEQKAVLVRSLKKQGRCVGMTGDGVNDILAMKEADCAIAMASGSEAARGVGNLVLQDNNFGNMPKVVFEGRRVINNVKSTSSLYIMKTLFVATLAVICIFMGQQYLFRTNNMLLFEMLVSGLPSIILSLQPNQNRIQGKFFSYVLCRAIPGALTMVFAVMAIYIGSYLQFGEFTTEYGAIAVMALTFSGLVMLFRLCQPFTPLRAGIFLFSTSVCILAFCIPYVAEFFYSGWSSIEFSLSGILLLICVIEAAFPLSQWLLKLFQSIQSNVDKNG